MFRAAIEPPDRATTIKRSSKKSKQRIRDLENCRFMLMLLKKGKQKLR